jgi:hypothetical protein
MPINLDRFSTLAAAFKTWSVLLMQGAIIALQLCTYRKCRDVRYSAAIGGRPDMVRAAHFR